MLRCGIGLAILFATTFQAGAQDDEDHYAQARLACLNDAVRLCPNDLLNPDQARECMKTKKALVSPECAEFYPGGKRAKEVQ